MEELSFNKALIIQLFVGLAVMSILGYSLYGYAGFVQFSSVFAISWLLMFSFYNLIEAIF